MPVSSYNENESDRENQQDNKILQFHLLAYNNLLNQLKVWHPWNEGDDQLPLYLDSLE